MIGQHRVGFDWDDIHWLQSFPWIPPMAEGKPCEGSPSQPSLHWLSLYRSLMWAMVRIATQRGVFMIANLAETIERLTVEVGLWIYFIGFIVAAVSSMLIVSLDVVLTAESVFNIPPGAEQENRKSLKIQQQTDILFPWRHSQRNIQMLWWWSLLPLLWKQFHLMHLQ